MASATQKLLFGKGAQPRWISLEVSTRGTPEDLSHKLKLSPKKVETSRENSREIPTDLPWSKYPILQEARLAEGGVMCISLH